jgi:hypothetical protein
MSQDGSFPSHTVRVKLSAREDSYVTLLVYSIGPDPLDLKLVGSEGEYAWSTASKFELCPRLGADKRARPGHRV